MSVHERNLRGFPGSPAMLADDYGDVSIELGRIGYEEVTPRWMEVVGQQFFVEVTTKGGEEIRCRVGEGVADLAIGDAVILAYVEGDIDNAIVVSKIPDMLSPVPSEVAGVSTGVAPTESPGVTAAAPTFTFVRTRSGRAYALETGAGGDVLLHSGGDVHVKAGATHIEGKVHLGEGPTTGPIAAKVGPGKADVPGVPMLPHVPAVFSTLTLPPFVGPVDAVVRAVDNVQSNAAVSPLFWAKWVGLLAALEAYSEVSPTFKPIYDTFAAIPPAASITSSHLSASYNVTAKG